MSDLRKTLPVARVEQVGPHFCSVCVNDDGSRRKLHVMPHLPTDGARLVCEDVEACRVDVLKGMNAGYLR